VSGIVKFILDTHYLPLFRFGKILLGELYSFIALPYFGVLAVDGGYAFYIDD
jgi:hypothetical protein